MFPVVVKFLGNRKEYDECFFLLCYIEQEVSFWLITNVFNANVKKVQVSKQFIKTVNQVLTSISDNVYHVFLAFSNLS